MANDNRTPREIATRTQFERPKQWALPDLLPEPDKIPGWEYRWVRVSMLNNADPRNLSSKLREGFEPVPIEEQPKYRMLTDPDGRFKDNIEIGGLLLCKIPEEFVRARFEHEARLTQANADAVDNSFLRQSDTRMPLFQERKSTVTFGNRT
jgi:hypothetical protein